MSEEMLALVLSLGLLAAMAAWVPFSWICNDRCQQLLESRRQRRAAAAESKVQQDPEYDRQAA